MKKMKCEICGSIDIKKTADNVFECQECGVQYSKDEAIKLLTEVDGPSAVTNNTPIPSARTEDLDDCAAVADTKRSRFLNGDPRIPPNAALKIENFLMAGNKLGAIGAYREATGAGLADAKAAVEKIMREM